MESFVSFVVFVALVCLLRVNLPEASLDSITANSNAAAYNKAIVKTAYSLGVIKAEFSDFLVFRTATLKVGDSSFQLVGIPFVGWGRV